MTLVWFELRCICYQRKGEHGWLRVGVRETLGYPTRQFRFYPQGSGERNVFNRS